MSNGEPCFASGPYDGRPLRNVPRDYLEHVASNQFLSDEILNAVRAVLNGVKVITASTEDRSVKRMIDAIKDAAKIDYQAGDSFWAVVEQMARNGEEMAGVCVDDRHFQRSADYNGGWEY